MNIKELKQKKISELNKIAKELNVEGASGFEKAGVDLCYPPSPDGEEWLDLRRRVLEILPDGFGFLRAPDIITYRAR